MPRYFAEIGPDAQVLRVVVAEDVEWLVDTLGGTWEETLIDGTQEDYAGISMFDTEYVAKERFVHTWQPLGAEGYPKGAKVWHAGHGWLSLMDKNVTEPGVAFWRNYAEAFPLWVQPQSEVYGYQKNERVTYNGTRYISLINGNHQVPDKSKTAWDPVAARRARDLPPERRL